jgi:hypothetical protein
MGNVGISIFMVCTMVKVMVAEIGGLVMAEGPWR